MRKALQLVKRLLRDKSSTLHVVYFIDHGQTRSIQVNRTRVILGAMIAMLLIGGGIAGAIFLPMQSRALNLAESKALDVKEQLLSYQLRYEKVWSEAYPRFDEPMRPQSQLASQQDTKTQTEPVKPQIEIASKQVLASKAEKPSPQPVAVPKTTKKPLAPRETPKKIAAKPQVKPEPVEKKAPPSVAKVSVKKPIIQNVSVNKKNDTYYVTFDLLNPDKKKAKGLFWAELTFETESQEQKALLSHPAAASLPDNIDKSIPTFSVQNFRRCKLQIPVPRSSSSSSQRLIVYLGDRSGKIQSKRSFKIATDIAGTSSHKKTQVQ